MKIKHVARWGTGKDGGSLPKRNSERPGHGAGGARRGGGGGGVLVLRPPSTIPRSN